MTPTAMAMRGMFASEPVAIAGNSPLTDAVLEALDALNLTDRELAALLKMPPPQLSRQKAGRDGNYLQVQRLDVLPDERRAQFLDALLDALARRQGRVIAAPSGPLKSLAAAMRAMSEAVEQMSANQPALPFGERRKEPRLA